MTALNLAPRLAPSLENLVCEDVGQFEEGDLDRLNPYPEFQPRQKNKKKKLFTSDTEIPYFAKESIGTNEIFLSGDRSLGHLSLTDSDALNNAIKFQASKEKIRDLAQKKIGLHTKDALGNTPLHNVVLSLRADALSDLLRNGADTEDMNFFGNTPAAIAAQNGLIGMLYHLILNGAHTSPSCYPTSPLMRAIARNHMTTASCLLKIEAATPFPHTPQAFFEAMRSKDYDSALKLLNAGANIDSSYGGETPLSYAIGKQRSSDACSLLKRGAKVNLLSKEKKRSLLFLIIHEKNMKAFRILLANKERDGINLSSRNEKKETPLLVAVRTQATEMIIELLNHTSQMNHDIDGNSALHIAAKNQDFLSALLLLKCNFRDISRNKDGKMAIDYARDKSCLQALFSKPELAKRITSIDDPSGFMSLFLSPELSSASDYQAVSQGVCKKMFEVQGSVPVTGVQAAKPQTAARPLEVAPRGEAAALQETPQIITLQEEAPTSDPLDIADYLL